MRVKKTGDGPWGEAIAYWLSLKGWVQADLVAAVKQLKDSKGNKNTVSTAFRGLDVQTRILRQIAKALKVPLEDVLISPTRATARERRISEVREITEDVWRRVMDDPSRAVAPVVPVAQPTQTLVERMIVDSERVIEKVEQRTATAKKRHKRKRAEPKHARRKRTQ